QAKDGVIEHYVCFSCVDGELYELDGGNPQPIHHGPSSPDSLLQAGCCKSHKSEDCGVF
uniref:UCH catalytic domain-containing protein n=1 Tax=Aegilops tauschii subsp. strangulata TaxID=200361 RepID=A0A453CKI8_AEGTS